MIHPTERRFVGSFPARLRGSVVCDRLARERRLIGLLRDYYWMLWSALDLGMGPAPIASGHVATFDPTSIANCVLDFDGSNSTGSLSLTSGAVTAFANRATGVAWPQATSTSRPTFQAIGLNSLPSVLFDGDDFFSSGEAVALAALSNNNPNSVFTVAGRTGGDTVPVFVTSSSLGAARPYKIFFQNLTNYSFETIDDSSGADQLVQASVGAEAWRIGEWIDAGNAVQALVNGTPLISSSYTGGTKTPTSITIGAFSSTTRRNYLTGYLGNVTIYSRQLTSLERSLVRVGFGARYGISVVP